MGGKVKYESIIILVLLAIVIIPLARIAYKVIRNEDVLGPIDDKKD